MKALLLNLFRRRAEQAPAPEVAPVPTPAPAPRKPASKRKYSKGKRHHPAPRGARKIDPNGPLIEQARQAGGIKR
ncbi:hypothetical protein NQH47_20290 [Burkholderia pseudomallei]|uniref:hypothetical protein n=1 Tax=Burkholderia pseudomallei TaxID=28450 RepID=UPI0021171D36|nr:hypothetical protein [Burkholderia pseudomallei]MCQ8223572.1 hypothetical protein [Burkholderia pseudomallei]